MLVARSLVALVVAKVAVDLLHGDRLADQHDGGVARPEDSRALRNEVACVRRRDLVERVA